MPVKQKKRLLDMMKDVDRQIFELQQKQEELKLELETCNREADAKFLIKNWKKLVEIENKHHPKLLQDIIVSCFPLSTSVCCCQSGSRQFISASHLFILWGAGFTFEDKPVTEIRTYNGRAPQVFYIDEDKIASKTVDYNEISHHIRAIKMVPLPSKRYSLTSISDIKLEGLV